MADKISTEDIAATSIASENLRIAIEISGNTIEEEIEMVRIIGESLVEAGFGNVFSIAAQPMYSNAEAVDNYNKQQAAISQEQPIVTVVSNKLH